MNMETELKAITKEQAREETKDIKAMKYIIKKGEKYFAIHEEVEQNDGHRVSSRNRGRVRD
jgi:hypothetical protein